ncbi:hypothetical protein L1787_14930 [Acuticoccus sp. M5D2P5]|uniref:hypothetical protein n=1 Tax=Acuticoccus kalidii TaxID=2910977 RepID=UPI001F2D4648|nr:hypothetical protein [Acuticoccus kalidii]MCF3934694.1 hypothetical protein [Acuticoccus kalidii]
MKDTDLTTANGRLCVLIARSSYIADHRMRSCGALSPRRPRLRVRCRPARHTGRSNAAELHRGHHRHGHRNAVLRSRFDAQKVG